MTKISERIAIRLIVYVENDMREIISKAQERLSGLKDEDEGLRECTLNCLKSYEIILKDQLEAYYELTEDEYLEHLLCEKLEEEATSYIKEIREVLK